MRTNITPIVVKTICVLAFFLLGTPALRAETSERDLFAEAESFYYAKNYPLAVESYGRFVDRYPFSELVPDAQYHRALGFFFMKKYDESLALLELIPKRYRSTRSLAFVPFYRGMIRFERKEYALAIREFGAFLENGGDVALSAQALYYRAVCETETGALEEARTDAKRFLEKHPRSELADYGFLLLAYIHFKRGDAGAVIALYRDPRAAVLPPALKDKFLLYYADALMDTKLTGEAAAIYESLLGSAPPVSSAALAKLFALAQAAGRVGEMEALARRAEDVLAGDPALLAEFWTNVGIASYAAGQLETAEYYFTRAWIGRDRVPVGESVPLYLSEVYSRRGNDAKALAVLAEYLAGKETHSEGVLLRLGNLAASAGDDAKAVPYLTEFLKRFPDSEKAAEARYLLAYAYYRTNEIDKGLDLTSGAHGPPDDHPLKGALVRLRGRLLLKKGDAAGAADLLGAYLSARTADLETRRDYAAALFAAKKYALIVAAVKEAGAPAALKRKNIELYLNLKYYEGLAFVTMKEYGKALASFAEFSADHVEKRGVRELYPPVVFYRGWAFYRLGKNAEAAPLFKSFAERYPEHALAPRALFQAGWCLYADGRFAEAAISFRALTDRARDRETKLEGAFFLGKSLLAQGRAGEAARLFTGIFEAAGDSPYAPDALFEYARLLADENRAADAAAAYVRLAERYPKHALAEEALWNRAQLYYRMNDVGRALDAFALYRGKFPSGGQADASYYWSGLCAAGTGDESAALGFWEKLIREYPGSSFRSEALKKAAAAYRKAGANDKALAAYRELISAYPKEAQAAGAADQARELQYLVQGYGDREAKLSAQVEKAGGMGTHAGRLAMADLAEYYLADPDGKKIDLAYVTALTLAERKDDREAAARARFLLGEYFNRRKEYERAGNEYLKAAVADPGNRERTAQYLYLAAKMMRQAGDAESAGELVARLVASFPDSRWTAEGKKLIEARP
ncbi:MAG: tetratricopeptide repeat protein [Spirochaetales bacterium]|nr:tetratricopeptide repeat protein [Spirochaetales bacterium]